MSLDSIVRKGVALANRVTGPLQVNIVHEAWLSSLPGGDYTYDTPTTRLAIVEYGIYLRTMSDGRQIQATAHVTFPYPLVANGAPGRDEPIDVRDRITLPRGGTSEIVDVRGFVDARTLLPYMTEVWLGAGGGV